MESCAAVSCTALHFRCRPAWHTWPLTTVQRLTAGQRSVQGWWVSAEADATPGFGALPGNHRCVHRSPTTRRCCPTRCWRGLEPATRTPSPSSTGPSTRGCCATCGCWPHEDAEDIAAETWLQVCRDLSRFRGNGAAFVGWLIAVGRNRAIDHFRASSRRPAVSVPTEQLTPLAGADDTEAQALTGISTAAAIALIASLPPDQAEAVMLRAVIGLDAKAAGQGAGQASRRSPNRGPSRLADAGHSDPGR